MSARTGPVFWRGEAPAAAVHGALAALLLVASLLPHLPARMLIFALLSGASPLLWARRDWGLVEWLVSAPAASLLIWGAIGLPTLCLGAASLLPALLAAGLALHARRRADVIAFVAGGSDLWALGAAALAAVPVALVSLANGFIDGTFFARGWVGRDGFYFMALAQETLGRHHWPTENPFVAGIANHYPSLLQVGVAALSAQGGSLAAEGTLRLFPVLAVTTVGLFVCAVGRAATPATRGWAGPIAIVGIVAAVLLRPDLFLTPQTQLFALPALMLLLDLGADEEPSPAELAASFAIGGALVFAHSLTGAAALAYLAGRVASELMALRAGARRGRSVAVACAFVALAIAYAYQSSFPVPAARVPYEPAAIAGIVQNAAPWGVALVALVAIMGAAARGAPLARGVLPIVSPIVVLIGLSAAYYGSGLTLAATDQIFVFVNGERFLFFALLFAVPIAAHAAPRVGVAAMIAVALGALVEPTTVARDTHLLWDAPPLELSPARLAFYGQLRAHTPKDARLLSLARDYALPAFTGRSQGPWEVNAWALQTLPTTEFDARWADVANAPTLAPVALLSVMDRWRYTHLLMAVRQAGDAVQIAHAFPPGTLRVVEEGGGLALFERTAP